jgi:hypothetical protein
MVGKERRYLVRVPSALEAPISVRQTRILTDPHAAYVFVTSGSAAPVLATSCHACNST